MPISLPQEMGGSWEQSPSHTHLLSSSAPRVKKSKAYVTPGALSHHQDKQTDTVQWPFGTGLEVRGGWILAAGRDASGASTPTAVFIFLLLRRRLWGPSEPQLVFIASRLKKSLSIFLERRGKGIFFP